MSHTIAAIHPYGAIDLKHSARRNLAIAGIIAVAIHLFGVASYWLSVFLSAEDAPIVTVRLYRYSELGPPPSLRSTAIPAVIRPETVGMPAVGIPVPVPDAEIAADHTDAWVPAALDQKAVFSDGKFVREGTGGAIDQGSDVFRPGDTEPPDFVPVEKDPVIVQQSLPAYPELARRAELEGTVVVKMWVTREGRVRKAVVLKSDAELFNQPAIDAAMQWVFTPALQHDKPVDVWVTQPFRFRLKSEGR
jgi:periplasmic protein TonB